mgnify:FL=1
MLGIFKKAFNSSQLADLLAAFTNNLAGTYVAKNYKEYIGVVVQSGGTKPTIVTILNDFSVAPSTTYNGTGDYYFTITGAFANQPLVTISQRANTGFAAGLYFDVDNIQILTSNTSLSAADSILNAYIYIRVYN